MSQKALVSALTALSLALGPAAIAQPGQNGKAPGKSGAEHAAPDNGLDVKVIISDGDREDIYDYGRRHPEYGEKPLPPGMYNRLAQGKPLPPGIAKKALPADLRNRISIGPGQDAIIIGRDVVIVSIKTETILDILRGVF